MYDDCDNDLIHETLVELMKVHNNLYVDISHDATNFYLKNIDKLLKFDNNKVIIVVLSFLAPHYKKSMEVFLCKKIEKI